MKSRTVMKALFESLVKQFS